MHKKEEKTINLKELVLYIGSYWKVVIIAIVIGAIAFGGLGYYKQAKVFAAREQFKAQAKAELDDDEKKYVEQIALSYINGKNFYKKLGKSYVSTMDSSAVYFTEISYYIAVDTKTTKDITGMYATYLSSLEFCDTISNSQDDITAEDIQTLVQGTAAKEVLTVVVRAATQEKRDELVELVKKEIEDYSQVIKKIVLDHSIIEMAEKSGKGLDRIVQRAQRENLQLSTRFDEEMLDIVKEISYGQLISFEEKVGKSVPELFNVEYETLGISIPSADVERPRVSKKYLVVGAMAGIFLSVMCLACYFIFSPKMYSRRELEHDFGLEVLGTFQKSKKVSKIRKALFNLNSRDEDSSYSLIANLIKKTFQTPDANALLLVSSCISKDELTLIAKKLEVVGLKGFVIDCMSFKEDEVAIIEALDRVESMVWVEQYGKTNKIELEREVALTEKLGANNIGIITQV